MTSQLYLVFVLSIIFHIKHLFCDYIFQTKYMIEKKTGQGWDFFIPLLLHCGIHAVFTLGIVWWVNKSLWYLAVIDLIVHFIMDRIKSGPCYLGRFKEIDTAAYWNIIGLDQMVHHLTHLYIIYRLVIVL